MRIRQVKPAFWSDEVMASMPKADRLVYIGLWMLADDAGWITRWNARQASAELFPYDPIKRRERDLTAAVERLTAAGRLVPYPTCGCLQVPHLPDHQRVSGRQTTTARDAHRVHVAEIAGKSERVAPVGNGRVGNGTERNGTVGNGSSRAAREIENPGESPLSRAAAAAGGAIADLATRRNRGMTA